jgi:threonine dehydratase
MHEEALAAMNDTNDDVIPIGLTDIQEAATRLDPVVHHTPVFFSRTLNSLFGATVYFKCENLQRCGAFKFRGAMNALMQLGEAERRIGVVTHSSGNHGQALALAGKLLQIPVCVVMPRTGAGVKRAATEAYGARVISCEPTMAARQAVAAELISAHGYTLIHPFDDWRIIAGQGTVALEFLQQTETLDFLICPVGGGGLISGTALAAHGLSGTTQVVGVEPALGDDARQSLLSSRLQKSSDPDTIADGLRGSLCVKTFAVIRRHVDAIFTATESEIVDAMKLIYERLKIVIEPSSAVAIAPFLNGQLQAQGRRVGVIISGGNVDLTSWFQSLAAPRSAS